MLPRKLLRVTAGPGPRRPAYLGSGDEVWVREVLTLLDALVGEPAHRTRPRLRMHASRVAAAHRVPLRAIDGVLCVLDDEYGDRVEASVTPSVARRAAFEAAAAQAVLDRAAALEAAAAALGTTPPLLERALFADHARERCLAHPERPPAPHEVVERYNLRLLLGLLACSEDLTVTVTSHVRSVARYAKLSQLICTFEERPGALAIHVSGPLSLFRFTLKYGRALARFAPAALATPGFALEAKAHLGDDEGPVVVRAQAGDPLPRGHALPEVYDSKLERQLVRDFEKLGTGWHIRREGAAIEAGGRTFYPDFVFARGASRVLVEVVGYFTPSYLAAKLDALAAARAHRVVVAIDESLGCADGEIPAAGVVRFKKRVDARALLAAIEHAAGLPDETIEAQQPAQPIHLLVAGPAPRSDPYALAQAQTPDE